MYAMQTPMIWHNGVHSQDLVKSRF